MEVIGGSSFHPGRGRLLTQNIRTRPPRLSKSETAAQDQRRDIGILQGMAGCTVRGAAGATAACRPDQSQCICIGSCACSPAGVAPSNSPSEIHIDRANLLELQGALK